VSAFDDTEEPPSDSDSVSYVADMSSVEDTDTVSGMTEVASAPALLMLASDELPLTEALSDLSLMADDDGRPPLCSTDDKAQLDNAFYFYQGMLTD